MYYSTGFEKISCIRPSISIIRPDTGYLISGVYYVNLCLKIALSLNFENVDVIFFF